MTRPARLGTDLDAVPVANASDRTAPTWEARALAAEARLAALPGAIAAAIEAQFVGQDHHEPTFNSGRDSGLRLAARIAREAQP